MVGFTGHGALAYNDIARTPHSSVPSAAMLSTERISAKVGALIWVTDVRLGLGNDRKEPACQLSKADNGVAFLKENHL